MSAFFIGHPKETDLALFAGGELGPLSRWRIERHIESCSECEALVADYFHLAEELQPLAALPALNWDAMAHGIEERLAAEEPIVHVQPRVPAMAWAAGLAAVAVISGVMVMRQQPSASPAKEMVAMESAAALRESEPQDLAAFAEMDRAKESRQAAPAPAPESQPLEIAEQSAVAKAEPAQPARFAAEQKREESEAPVEVALADELAPPPPPAPSDLRMARSAQAPPAALGGTAGGFAAPAVANVADAAGEGTFDIQPLFDPTADVRIASDGWISVRSISAEGRVTITDVYAP